MSLAQELKQVVARHLEQAPTQDVIQIVSALCAVPAQAAKAEPLQISQRLTKLDAKGKPLFDGAKNWVAVYDAQHQLTWTREASEKRHDWKSAKKAAATTDLFGHSDWRLPTIRELLTLVDYERNDPAIDTTYFDAKSDWYWSGTPLNSAPADCAWIVLFTNGDAYYNGQNSSGLVRAVRSGQFSDFGG